MSFFRTVNAQWLLLTLVGFAQAKSTSLNELYNDAINFNQTIATAESTVQQAKGARFESIYNFVPAPLVSFNKEHIENTYKDGSKKESHPENLGVSIEQTLSAPKIYNVISANQSIQSTEASFRAEHSVLLNSVISQYANILTTYESLAALKIQANYLKKVYDQERQKLRLGSSTKANVAQAKTSYDVVLAQEVDAKRLISTGLNELYTLTGKNYTELPKLSNNIKLSDLPSLKNVTSYQDSALTNNDNIKASKLNVKANRSLLNAARGSFLPYITYTLNYTNKHKQSNYLASQTVEESTLTTFGLAYNLASNPGTVMQQQGVVNAAIANNKGIITSSLSNIATAYESVLASKESIKRYQNAVNSAEISFKATKASYNAGTMTLLDVLDSIQELQNNQTELAKKRYEYITYYAQLRLLAGEKPQNILGTLDRLSNVNINVRDIRI